MHLEVALALNRPRLGLIEEGTYADIVCIQPPLSFEHPQSNHPFEQRSISTLIAQLVFCEDWDGTLEVLTRGVTRWTKDK